MIEHFISSFITHRPSPLTTNDLKNYQTSLEKAITGKSVLVIGGAGSIGSSFITQLLPFRPASLTVVDVNENGLAELARGLRSDPLLSQVVPEEFLLYPMDFASKTFEKMFRGHKRRNGNNNSNNNVAVNIDKHTVDNKSALIGSDGIDALMRNNNNPYKDKERF